MRIWGNSLRLRLSQSEVARVASGGKLEERIEFGAGEILGYVVECVPGATALSARFSGQRIVVTVPASAAQAWAASGDVGLYAGAPLKIAVEKDFRCTTEAENPPDAYPNPLKAC